MFNSRVYGGATKKKSFFLLLGQVLGDDEIILVLLDDLCYCLKLIRLGAYVYKMPVLIFSGWNPSDL